MNQLQRGQLLGTIQYEFRLYWRRWALWILVWACMVVLALYIWLGGGSLEMLNHLGAPADRVRDALTGAITFSTWAPVAVALIFALPVLVCDTIPLERQSGVNHLLQSLPVSPTIYLLGRILGMWVSVMAGMLAVAVVIGVVWWVKVGAFNLGPYLEMWLVGVGSLSLLNGALGVIAGTFFTSRRQSILFTVAGIFVMFAVFGASLAETNLMGIISPMRGAILNYYIFNVRQLLDAVSPQLLSTPQALLLTILSGLLEIILFSAIGIYIMRWRESRQ